MKNRTKVGKQWGTIAFLFLCMSILCMVNAGVVSIHAQDANVQDANEQSHQCTLEATIGYGDGIVHLNHENMVRATVSNSSKKDLEGYVVIHSTFEEEDADNMLIREKVIVAAGETKQVQFGILENCRLKQMVVKFESESGTVYATTQAKISCISSEGMMVGVLSKQKDRFGYFENQNAYVKVVELNKEDIPESLEQLQAFEILVLDGFDLSALDQTQIDTLKEWESAGGTLVLGAGEAEDISSLKTLGETVEKEDGKVVLPKEKAAYRLYGKNKIPVYLCKENKGMRIVFQQGASLSPEKWDVEGKQYTKLIRENSGFYADNFNYTDNYVSGTSTFVPEKFKSDNFVIVYILLVIYILLISIVFRIWLHKKDKLEKIWLYIPICSGIFVISIYFLGSSSRLSGVYLDYQNVVEYTEDSAFGTANSAMCIYSTSNKKYTLQVPEEMRLYQSGDDMSKPENPDYTENLSRYMTITSDEKGTNVEFIGNHTFQKNTVNAVYQLPKKGSYKADITEHQNQYQGTFQNNTGETMKSAVFIAGEKVYAMGDIKDGESVTIGEELQHANLTVSEYLFNPTGAQRLLAFGKITKEMEENEYNNVALTAFKEYICRYSYKKNVLTPKVVCLVNGEDSVMKQWNAHRKGKTLKVFDVPVKNEVSGEHFLVDILNSREEFSRDASGNYWAYDKKLIVNMQLHESEKLKSLQISKEQNVVDNNKWYDEIADCTFRGKIEFYNYKKKEYELVFENVDSDQELQNVNDYVDSNNRLRVCIRSKQKDDDYMGMQLPVISATVEEVAQ